VLAPRSIVIARSGLTADIALMVIGAGVLHALWNASSRKSTTDSSRSL